MFWKTKQQKEYKPSIYDIKNILERKFIKGSTSLSAETRQRLFELVEQKLEGEKRQLTCGSFFEKGPYSLPTSLEWG